jgi:hypothetical protein
MMMRARLGNPRSRVRRTLRSAEERLCSGWYLSGNACGGDSRFLTGPSARLGMTRV